MTLLLYTENPESLAPLTDGLADRQRHIRLVSTEGELRRLLDAPAVEAVIAEDSNLELMKSVIRDYPLYNYALISPRSEKDFHTITEGYGFFMQIPDPPRKQDALALLGKLEKITRFTATRGGVTK